jgi:uncharacterized membrane protein YfcA
MSADMPGLDTSVIATAATARAASRRNRTRIALGVSAAVTVLWTAYATAFGQWERIGNNWFAGLTMVFGSFVAGSTPQGGGAVAFPVFTKALEVPSDVARSFSLCVQMVGMGTATASILINRRVIEWRAVAIGGATAMLTFVVALFVLADPNKPFWPSRLPGAYVKVTFTILVASMAFVVYLGTKVRIRKVDAALPALNGRLYVALIVAGIAGGIASALTGSGADVMIYLFIVVLLGVDPRVGVPTSVIVMTLVSVLGFLVLGVSDGQLSIDLAGGSSGAVIGIGGEAVTGSGGPGTVVAAYGAGGSELSAVRFDLFGMWIASLPVVAWGAPLGAFVASRMKARHLVYFAVALAAAETISTAIFLTELHELGWLFVYAVVGMLVMGTTLYFLAKYRRQVFALPGLATDEGLGRGHLDVVQGYEQQLSDDERPER